LISIPATTSFLMPLCYHANKPLFSSAVSRGQLKEVVVCAAYKMAIDRFYGMGIYWLLMFCPICVPSSCTDQPSQIDKERSTIRQRLRERDENMTTTAVLTAGEESQALLGPLSAWWVRKCDLPGNGV
jgi:hypothetical protein